MQRLEIVARACELIVRPNETPEDGKTTRTIEELMDEVIRRPGMQALARRFPDRAPALTGAMTLVRSSGHRLLVDCCMVQGLAARTWRFPEAVREAASVVLTHGHLDHVGSLPTGCAALVGDE